MKKFSLFSILVLIVLTATSQSQMYKSFKVNIGPGFAIPSGGSGTKAGITFTLEPQYRITDNLSVGLRIEGAALGYETTTNGNSDVKFDVLDSYCATGEYYFKPTGFRTFGGAGIGIFKQSSLNSDANLGKVGSKFGFFPRLGFETGHFRMSASYNILGSDVSYLSFNIGFFFGGGKKSSK